MPQGFHVEPPDDQLPPGLRNKPAMEDWKKNLGICWIGQFFSIMGFSFALPFAPYYLQELGITDPAQLRLWTGFFSSATGFTMMFAAPIWGYLADRMGRKLMTLRAGLGGAIVLLGMALATSPEMVLFFRMMQGVFTGTITAYLTLVVAQTPKQRMGFAIGVLNSAVFCGNSVSPLLGGVFADLFGYRASFFVAAGLLFMSFVISLIFIQEGVRGQAQTSPSFFRDMRTLLLNGSVLSILGMLFFYALSLTIQSPQLPLLIRHLVNTDHNLATQAGLVMSAGGVASVLSGMIFGTLADRGKIGYLGSLCAIVGSVFVGVMVVAQSTWQLAVLNFLFALAVGGIDPILKTLVTHHVPIEQRGSVFGLIGSARSAGWFVGSLGGGILASRLGVPPIFLISAVLFVVIAGLLLLFGRK